MSIFFPSYRTTSFADRHFQFNPPFHEAVASLLVRSTPNRTVRVRGLAGETMLCSWATHLTLTVPLSTQVYKMGTVDFYAGGNPVKDKHPSQGERRNTPSRFMQHN